MDNPIDKIASRNPQSPLSGSNQTVLFPIDRRSAPNEKGDAVVAASPDVPSPTANEELTYES